MAVVECDFQNNLLSVHKRRAKDGCPVAAVSKELPQIITAQTVTRSAVGTAGGRKVPAQSPRNFQRKAQGTPHLTPPFAPQSLELQPFPLEVLPSLIPSHTELPTIPRAANASGLFLGQDRCRVHPCRHKLINRRLRSPQAQLQFPLQMDFCYKLCCAAVACKKWSYSKKWF